MAVIGALRGVLSLDSAAFEKGAKRAQASMNDLQRRLAKSGAAMKSVGNKMSLYVTAPLSAMATVAVKSSLSTIDAQAKLAQSMGTTTRSVQVLQRAGDLAGVSMGQIEQATVAMTKRLSQAAAGTGPAAKALDQLGLSALDLVELDLDERIATIQNAIEDMVPAAERAGVASQIFGDRAAVMFSRIDADVLAQASDEIERFGVGVSDVDADQIEAANDAISALGLVSKGLANQLTVALAPILQDLAEKAQDLGAWFSGLNDNTKTLIAAGGALAAALGPVLIGLGLMASLLATLSSPVLLVAAGIAALAGVGAALAANWDSIRDKYPGLAGAIEGGVKLLEGAVSVVSDVALGVGTFVLEQLEASLIGVRALFEGDWQAVWENGAKVSEIWKQAFSDMWIYINDLMGGWPDEIRARVVELAGEFTAGLADLRNDAQAAFEEIWYFITAEVSTWPGRFYDFGVEMVRGLIIGIKERTTEAVAAVGQLAIDMLDAGKEALGIQSPSKEFEEIGQYTIEGMTLGIESQAAALEDAISGVMGGGIATAADEALGLQQVFDGVLDGTITSWEDALDSMWDTFKSWLSNMIFTGANNPIQIGASFTGSGGAGVTQSLSGLSSGFGSFFGEWGGTGLLGGASGLIENTLANGFSGFTGYIESALAGATGSLAGFGTALGAIALPLAGVGLLISGFQSKTEVLSESMKISAEGLDATLEQITKTETSRFWGLSKSTSTDTEDIGGSEFDDAVRAIQDSVLDLASTFNIGAEALAGFTYSSKWDVGDLSQDEALAKIEEELGYYGDALSAAVLDWGLAAEGLAMTWQDIADEGQTATDVLEDLNLSLAGVNAMFEYMQQAAYGASLSGALAADELVDLFGSLDDMSAALTSYMNLFYSEAERFEFAILDIERALSDLGFEMPATLDGFRDLVEAQDLATEAGRETYAALIILAETFYDVMEAAGTFSDELVDAFGELGDSINTLLADAAADQDEAQAAADAWRDTADSLRDFVADLTGEYSPEAALEAAAASYSDTLLKALAGDQDAAKEFPDIAGDYLDAAAGQVSSGAEYEHLVKRTQQDALRLADAADEQASLEETMVDLYQEQIDILEQLAVFLDYANSLSSDEIAALGGMETVLGAIDAGVAGYQVGLDAIALALANPLSVDFASLESTITAALEPATLFGDFETTLAKALAPSTDALTGSIDYLREMIEAEIRLLGEIENIDVSDLIPDAAPPDYTAMIADLNAQLASLSFGDVAGLTAAYNAQVAADKLLTDNAGDYTRSADAQAIWDQVVAAREAEQTAEDLRNQIVALGGVPLYSSGTDFHPGGLAMVHGPELINLPRGSNVTSVSDTKGLFAGLAAELGAVHREIAALRSEQRQLGIQTANNTRKTSRTLEKFDKDGLPAERTT